MNLIVDNNDNILEIDTSSTNLDKVYCFDNDWKDSVYISTDSTDKIIKLVLKDVMTVVDEYIKLNYKSDCKKLENNQYHVPYNYDTMDSCKVVINRNKLVLCFGNPEEIDSVYTDDESDIEFAYNSENEENPLKYISIPVKTKEYMKLKEKLKDKGCFTKQEKDRLEMIDNLEQEQGIYFIQSSCFGSRCWGYDDENSDYDMRFIYVKKLGQYFTMDKKDQKDTITLEDDVVGYEVGKVLKTICNQNPMTYEILYSPINDLDNPLFDEIKDFSKEYFQPKKMVNIYEHVIDANIHKLETEERKSLKVYLFVLRMMGVSNYIRKNKSYPICGMDEVFDLEENAYLRPEVDKLIEMKKQGVKNIEVTDELIESLMKKSDDIKELNSHMEDDLVDTHNMVEKANQLYRKAIQYSRQRENEDELLMSLYQEDNSIKGKTL